jgi:ABC-type phosphate transport system ATPase subunit
MDYTTVIVIHNMVRTPRMSGQSGFGDTEVIVSRPREKAVEGYVSGRSR